MAEGSPDQQQLATKWNVFLEDGTEIPQADPYGHEYELKVPGKFAATILLSPINQRIQVYGYEAIDLAAMVETLRALAQKNNYGKVWVKAPARDARKLETLGFDNEGTIPGYFNMNEDAACMGMFVDSERRNRPTLDEENEFIEKALAGRPGTKSPKPLPTGYTTALFTDADAPELAALYDEVFPTYPYPITDPEYLKETARTHILYRLVRNADGKLVAAASAETNPNYQNSEMTDFAALPSERGKGLALFLLHELERDAVHHFGIRCFYTIARALEPGVLRTFHHAGYRLAGTLVNNCNIAGKFETMHLMVRD